MLKRILSVALGLSLLVFTAFPVQTPAQIPVTDVAHITTNAINWALNLGQWAIQLARVLQTYQQLVRTYEYMQALAKNLEHPEALAVVPLFAIGKSALLTKTDSIEEYRKFLEGGAAFSAQLGAIYHQIYGAPLDLSKLVPSQHEDWAKAAERMNRVSQAADSAILETLAIVSQSNRDIESNKSSGVYQKISAQLKASGVNPQKVAQAGALSSLYAAQNIERLTQIVGAQAAMQAQDYAQKEADQKAAVQAAARDKQYQDSVIQYLKSHAYKPDPWN
jgi:hypothetical protein